MANLGKIIISKQFKTRLENQASPKNENVIGYLFGVTIETDIYLFGAAACKDKNPKVLLDEYHSAKLNVPPGLAICGVYLQLTQADIRAVVEQVCQRVLPSDLKQYFVGKAIAIYAFDKDPSNPSQIYLFDVDNQTLEKGKVEVSSGSFLQSCLLFRLKASASITVNLHSDKKIQHENLLDELNTLQGRLAGPGTIFRIKDSNIFVNAEGKLPSGEASNVDGDSTHARTILSEIDNEEYQKLAKKKNSDLSQVIIMVEMFNQLTGDHAASQTIKCAPIVHHKHNRHTAATIPLAFDVLCYVHENEPVNLWHSRISEAVNRQMVSIAKCLIEYSKDGKFLAPQPFHFWPLPLEHPITAVYPSGISEDDLLPQRKAIHQKYLLPENQPFVRRLNAHLFPGDSIPGGYLINTHKGLPPSGVKDGEEHFVNGTYSYHHYMQDRMNDDGWGCAYRSLQTLVSWFRFQGYSDKHIPSHSEIQQVLVDIGDKPAKFVNSRQWIGSMEVSYVLNTWMEIESKTLYVSSGAELASKGRDLAMHFDTQGTPIMIGGGVLAHTILGVSFSEVTGEVKFLILDPHYKGGEDLRTIQKEGWCGWKGADFWDQNAYYNMCMPQKPKMM